MCPRSLEGFDKQLQDWLAKDPAINTSTTPGTNKRKRRGGDGEEGPDEISDGTLTPTKNKKRILFSQSKIGKPLLNADSGHHVEPTSEQTSLSGTGLGVVVVGKKDIVAMASKNGNVCKKYQKLYDFKPTHLL